jgi:hypothetical protein
MPGRVPGYPPGIGYRVEPSRLIPRLDPPGMGTGYRARARGTQARARVSVSGGSLTDRALYPCITVGQQ